MGSVLKFFINFPSNIRFALLLNKAECLDADGYSDEAFELFLSMKHRFNEKSYRYHLSLGRLYLDYKQDYSKAIDEFKKAVVVLNKKKFLKENDRQYYLSYSKYVIVKCLNALTEFEEADTWRGQCESHEFDLEKVSESARRVFPYV